ncbi:MAG: F0F1 ATP synthase subunit B [Anaerolineales bacterium]|nr:F0F1 ATP synthase subunit B [Anaerolineales bacterium]
MAALGINLGFLLFQIFNFLILMTLLYAWAYKPIINALDKRKQAIAQGLEDARIAAEARANAEQEARQIIARAQSEASEKVREASERAESAAKGILAQTEVDAAKAREDVVAEAQQERDRLLTDMRGQVAALAMAAAQRLIGETLDEKRQHVLIDEFFSGVKAGKVVVLGEETGLRAATAEIVSALPLTEAERETIRQEIIAKAGSQTVAFRVDPNILGGLVVKLGDKVLDGSVAGQLESLRQSLS